MKKTLITLMALTGIAGATDYVYTGDSNAWLEVAKNWKDTATNTPLTGGDANGNLTETQTEGNTFTVDGGTVKGGKMCHFTDATLNIKSNANVSITGAQKNWTDATVIVASGSKLTLAAALRFDNSVLTVHGNDISITANDIKLWNTTLNVLSGTVAFQKTWFDNGSDSTNGITINLAEGAKVSFSESVMSTDWNSTITLSTTFSNGYVQNGTGDVIWTAVELIDFGTKSTDFDSNSNLSNYLTNGYFKGDSFKVNGSALTLGSFDTSALSAEDVGKYQFAVVGNKLMVQYAAYSQSIPEPTTATLSLLALAGLAARRRRR